MRTFQAFAVPSKKVCIFFELLGPFRIRSKGGSRSSSSRGTSIRSPAPAEEGHKPKGKVAPYLKRISGASKLQLQCYRKASETQVCRARCEGNFRQHSMKALSRTMPAPFSYAYFIRATACNLRHGYSKLQCGLCSNTDGLSSEFLTIYWNDAMFHDDEPECIR